MLSSIATIITKPPLHRRLLVASFSSSSSVITREDRWDSKFEALKDCIDKHERVNDNAVLHKWLSTQRGLYRNGSARLLIDGRRERLESLKIPLYVYDENWEQQYEQLKEFREVHGHSNVTMVQDEQLANWVQRQRKLYRGGTAEKLAEDRVEKLNAIDFQFDVQKAAWMEKYDELLEYRSYHGDCIVPNEYDNNRPLGIWVDQQRQHYSRRINGKEVHSMTDERIELLDAIDFCWNALDARWLTQFEELNNHVRVNGFGRSPPRSSRQLQGWLTYQRKLYREQQNGEEVSLNADRLLKLRSLGFCL